DDDIHDESSGSGCAKWRQARNRSLKHQWSSTGVRTRARRLRQSNCYYTGERLPSAFGVVRTTEQPNSKAVCVEVHSTRPAELAKACGAALLSSFRCLTPEARITTTLFVKRTTKFDSCRYLGFSEGEPPW